MPKNIPSSETKQRSSPVADVSRTQPPHRTALRHKYAETDKKTTSGKDIQSSDTDTRGSPPPSGQRNEKPGGEAEKVRLNHLLQLSGVCSRRAADRLISEGRVKVSGHIVTQLGTLVDSNAAIAVDNTPVSKKPSSLTILFHKPDLYLSSRVTEGELTSIFEIKKLKRLPNNVQTVGRLDFRTEGLMILTNDGLLAQALAHPRNEVPKTYMVLLNREITTQEMAQIRKGIRLQDGLAKPDLIKKYNRHFLGSEKRGQWVQVVVSEGRNRLIRRIFEAFEFKVVRLIRVAIGQIALPEDLKAGDIVNPTPSDLEFLKQIKDRFLKSKKTGGTD